MKAWAILLGPLAIWALHFFGAYLAAEFVPASIAVFLPVWTALCLAADLALVITFSAMENWKLWIVRGSGGLAAVAIFWQTLPLIVA